MRDRIAQLLHICVWKGEVTWPIAIAIFHFVTRLPAKVLTSIVLNPIAMWKWERRNLEVELRRFEDVGEYSRPAVDSGGRERRRGNTFGVYDVSRV